MMMMDGHMMAPWGWVMMVIFWGLVIAVLVFGVRWLVGKNRSTEGGGGGREPLDILKERYAKGEITREEFERIKKDLE